MATFKEWPMSIYITIRRNFGRISDGSSIASHLKSNSCFIICSVDSRRGWNAESKNPAFFRLLDNGEPMVGDGDAGSPSELTLSVRMRCESIGLGADGSVVVVADFPKNEEMSLFPGGAPVFNLVTSMPFTMFFSG